VRAGARLGRRALGKRYAMLAGARLDGRADTRQALF
jgi:hypothetical protein